MLLIPCPCYKIDYFFSGILINILGDVVKMVAPQDVVVDVEPQVFS